MKTLTQSRDHTMTQEKSPWLHACLDALLPTIPLQELWLFGSCARGEQRDNSDIDLLLLLKDGHTIKKPNLAARKALNQSKALISYHAICIPQSAFYAKTPGIIPREAKAEGIKLYPQ